MKFKSKFIGLFVISFLIGIFPNQAKSQGSNSFKSYGSGFTIELPQRVQGAGGNGTAGGVKFLWNLKEAEYQIGYFEKLGLPLALNGDAFSYEDAVKKYFNEFSAKGERLAETQIVLEKYQGKQFNYLTNAKNYILRLYEVEDRIYYLQASFPLNNAMAEAKVIKTFDTFQLFDKETVEKELSRLLKEATPNEPPQTPIVPKTQSDVADRQLKGKVKSVAVSNSYFNLKNTLRKPLLSLYEEFNESGNLIKTIEYNSYGNPWQIKRYGYVAGQRVANWGSVKYEYDILGGIALPVPAGAKVDNRFDERFVYKYLNGKLTEEAAFLNMGLRTHRATFTYFKEKKESFFYGSESLPFSKLEEYLNSEGNVEKSVFSEKQGKKFAVSGSFNYKYEEFDNLGNWTRRIVSKDYGFGNQTNFVPEYVEIREIKYY